MYYEINTNYGKVLYKIENNNKTIFPETSDNTDYQAYLKWLEEGNEPLPAEEQA